tara:strand:+ start:2964 stop:3197 length:234 start_codon:yes stop_codon:yes gene_type:complete
MTYTVLTIELIDDEGVDVVTATGQPPASALIAFSLDTLEGLVVCHGEVRGDVLEDRPAAEAKFVEMTGRAPAPGELP